MVATPTPPPFSSFGFGAGLFGDHADLGEEADWGAWGSMQDPWGFRVHGRHLGYPIYAISPCELGNRGKRERKKNGSCASEFRMILLF